MVVFKSELESRAKRQHFIITWEGGRMRVEGGKYFKDDSQDSAPSTKLVEAEPRSSIKCLPLSDK